MLMRTEPLRREPRPIDLEIRGLLTDRDFIALAYFAALGLLVTILLARIFPLEQADNVLMRFG
jgi:hypothetical protein